LTRKKKVVLLFLSDQELSLIDIRAKIFHPVGQNTFRNAYKWKFTLLTAKIVKIARVFARFHRGPDYGFALSAGSHSHLIGHAPSPTVPNR
jgi:hypothetical protein